MTAESEISVQTPASGAPSGPPMPSVTSGPMPDKPGFELPFDPLRLLAAVLRQWFWILLSGVGLAGLAGLGGYFKFEPQFTASAQFMRQEPSGSFRASDSGEPFKPRQLSVATLVSFMKSPAVLQRVSEQSQPRLSPRAVLGGLTITPERSTDLISVSFKSSRSDQTALRVLNLFGAEVVRLTREMQAQEAIEVNRLLRQQLSKADEELRKINQELLAFAKEAGLVNVDKEIDAYLGKLGNLDLRYETTRIDYETFDLKIRALEKELSEHNPLGERVEAAREKLAELRGQFTDTNPMVDEQKDRVAELEKILAESVAKPIAPPRQGESALAASFYQELVSLKSQKEVLAAQLEKLKAVRASVDEKLRELPEKGMQYARIKARQQSLETAQLLLASRQREAQLYEDNPLGYYRFFEAKPDQVETVGRGKKLLLLAGAGGVLGALFSLALVCLAESFDDRVKTMADARRVTKLPLLASLPDLASLDVVAQANWAFRTWMALQARLSTGPNQSIVCGLAASTEGEGCSTWIELLARAASQREAPVLAITDRPPLNGVRLDLEEALQSPAGVARPPGAVTWLVFGSAWRWDLKARLQWHAALEEWQRASGLVVLLELKAVEQPDTLLLAEALPQLIWLSGSHQALARLTSQRLSLLRHARCRFAGLVLNREKKLFPSLRAA